MNENDREYWSPRECLREPISELFEAAFILEEAVSAHMQGERGRAARLLSVTNTSAIRDYIESLWGSAKRYPDQKHFQRVREVKDLKRSHDTDPVRMPNKALKDLLIERDGYRCRYCSVPVIPVEVRKAIHKNYPEALPWGAKNIEQHSAFQALWLQFDHITPHSYGGTSEIGNLVIACAGCNFGKDNYNLEELGLIHPLLRSPIQSSWTGLTQFKSREPA